VQVLPFGAHIAAVVLVVLVCTRVVVVRRTVVAVGVVVVVTVGHVAPPQASQQLATSPTQALPPLGGRHAPALGLMLHLGTPRPVVRQQVTNPRLPQVDFAAHRLTAPLHAFGNAPALTAVFAAATAHLTYVP